MIKDILSKLTFIDSMLVVNTLRESTPQASKQFQFGNGRNRNWVKRLTPLPLENMYAYQEIAKENTNSAWIN